MRIHFVLPGLHRVNRGAEVAFESVAAAIARLGRDEVTLVGSGQPTADRPYHFRHVGLIPRERFEWLPAMPVLRTNTNAEEASFAANALRQYRSSEADITLTCGYPFVNWLLTRWPPVGHRPPHVFVTQNGDWAAYSEEHEYKFFRCDGLICTNPIYYDRNQARWPSALIPNGIDTERFTPGPTARARFDLPEGKIVLMVSALIESKRVLEAMRSVAAIPDAQLVVAGDGPLRDQFDELGQQLMPGRFRRLTLTLSEMPDLYRSADVMLHPTFHESFGNVYAEALAIGVPVVAHDYAVTRWIFGNDHPGLVDAADEAAVTAAINQALQSGRADAMTRTEAAAERFSWANIARQYRDFLAEVHERHRKRGA